MPMFKRGCVVLLVIVAACGGNNSAPSIVVSPGTWSYMLSATGVPLHGQPGSTSCAAPSSSGTTVVSSSGTFAIPFAGLTCDSCTMSGTITGTIMPASVAGNVSVSVSGSGCTNGQPQPSPASMSGTCTSAGCSVILSSNQDTFAISYTLTPP
jgi:hypothetical protein